MRYILDETFTGPKYMQVYESVRQDILTGALKSGERLPGKRIMAEEFHVSLMTMTHALELLEEEGYVEAEERKGFFVSARKEDLPYEADGRRGENISVESSQRQEDFPAALYARTVRQVLTDYGDRIMEKSEPHGLLSTRQAVSRYLLRSRNIRVSPEQIILCPGSEYAYGLLISALGRSRIYGLEEPSYEKIRKVYRANGVRLDFLKLGKEGILSSELERTPAAVLHVTPYNSYPSHVTAGGKKREEYLQWALKRDAVIIEDDYDSEFSSIWKREASLYALRGKVPVIYLNTFSRTISKSVRISYMVIPEELMDLFEEKTGFYSCSVSTLSQLVLEELLNSGRFERHIQKVRNQRRKSR